MTFWTRQSCSYPDKDAVCAEVTWRLVLLSEKGELKKPLTMLMMDSVTHFSRNMSACFLSVVVLQTWRQKQTTEKWMFYHIFAVLLNARTFQILSWNCNISNCFWYIIYCFTWKAKRDRNHHSSLPKCLQQQEPEPMPKAQSHSGLPHGWQAPNFEPSRYVLAGSYTRQQSQNLHPGTLI